MTRFIRAVEVVTIATGGLEWMNNMPVVEPKPILSEDANTACGTWIDDHDFYGKDMEAVPAEGRLACTLYCSQKPGCNAVTWNEYDRVCFMKRIPDDYAPVSHPGVGTLRLCQNQRSKEPFDEANAPKPETTGEASEHCGEWLEDYSIQGTLVTGERVTKEQNKEQCLHKCILHDTCNAALFNYRTKACHALVAGDDARPEAAMDWEMLRICMGGAATECGEWIENGDLFGHDIPNTGTVTPSRDECRRQCAETPDCNAVTYKIHSDKCWMKNIPPGRGGGDGKSMDSGVVAGISLGALVLLLSIAGLCLIAVVGRRRRRNAEDKGVTGSVSSVKDALVVDTCDMLVSRASTQNASSQLVASQRATKSDTTMDLSNEEPGNLEVSTGQASGKVSDTTDSIRNPAPSQHMTTRSTSTVDKNRSLTKETVTITSVPSTAHVSIHPVPEKGASDDVKRDYVHNQLDRIEALQFKEGKEGEVLEGLRFSGTGPQDRLEGGQAIVQIAYSRLSRLEYAIKFFLTQTGFEQEMGFYSGSNPLGQFLPQVRSVVPNDDKNLVDPSGHPLPPCIVMERGEPLDVWSQRNAPDRALAFAVVYHIAQRMAEFHGAGYVHRDLKPGNVMWLPRTNRWTVIDFGCAAQRRHDAPIAYTLRYAAPEVILAKRRGEETMVVEESLDAWSLGVMAFEMCMGSAAFPRGTPSEQIKKEIAGVEGAELPWEGSRLTAKVEKKLHLFQGSLLQLLNRDPSKRPSMRQFCRICAKILGENTEVPSPAPSYAENLNEQGLQERSQETLDLGMNSACFMGKGDFDEKTKEGSSSAVFVPQSPSEESHS